MRSAADKILVNTGILYLRMILTVGVSLYTTKLVLEALGSTDFGIFNLIAGVIALLAFLNNAMATATQRFLSFYQGSNDSILQIKVFTSSVVLHLIIAIFIFLILEIAGFYIFDGFLSIPEERVDAAKLVYRWVGISVFLSIITVPFSGTLMAHENMLWIAIVGIIEVLIRLIVALFLFTTLNDRLVIFAMSYGFINLLTLCLYASYCFSKYPECKIRRIGSNDFKIAKEITSFTGWNMFGALCSLGRTQGIAVILNLFFGVIVNSAYGIANQISSQLNFLSSTLLRAINPQIMKSEGSGNRERMLRLSMSASKFCFFLFAMVAIPFTLEMKQILSIWLGTFPEYTIAFCQIIIISILLNQTTIGLQSSFQAIGKIKYYQMIIGSLILLSLPLSYILLKIGASPEIALMSLIVMEILGCIGRIFLLNKTVGGDFNIWLLFWNKVFKKELIPVLVNICVCLAIIEHNELPFRFILTIIASAIAFIFTIYFTGLTSQEKGLLSQYLVKIYTIIKRKSVNHNINEI